ncbi:MAG: c-type cytochrome biogenesis protein CcmI [Rhodospirillales bacterium]|nr:c-type cytochrome biogenesis protein CcmI [Rhodospirillales bacterium]
MTLALVILALTAATLAFLLIPLVRRQPPPPSRAAFDAAIFRDRLKEIDREVERGVISAAEAEASRTEIHRRLLAAAREEPDTAGASRSPQTSWRTIVAIAVLVPAGGLALYLAVGSPNISDHLLAARRDTPAAHAGEADGMEQAVERLAQRLQGSPDDVDGWQLLARSYVSMQRFGDAAKAYRQAMRASSNRPDIAADYAEVLFVTAGSTVTAEARAILEAVQAADPINPKARYYLGLAMAERGDFRGALQAWIDLALLSPEDAPWMPFVRENIGRAAGELGLDARSIPPSAEAVRLAGSGRTVSPPPKASVPARGDAVAPPLKTEEAEAIAAMPEAERAAMIRGMVERLAQRLKDNPDDREGWLRLARAYDVLGEREKAKEARARAGEAK